MKRFAGAVLAASLLALTGCGTIDKLFDKQVQTDVARVAASDTNPGGTLVVAVGDEQYQVPAMTAADVGPGLELKAPGRTILVTTNSPGLTANPGDLFYTVTRTNLVDNPMISGALQGASQLPVPWLPLVASMLGWAYTGYRNVRNAKAAEKNKTAAVSVIAAVDQMRLLFRDTEEGRALDAKLKRLLQDHQIAMGVANEVAALVEQYTNFTRAKS